MTYKYIVLVLKSEKQHDAALQDLRELGLYPTILSPWERICDSTYKPCVGFTTTSGFCSNGTFDYQQLEQYDMYVASTRKEFIQEVKKYLV
jgi:hypothetical protein